MKDNPQPSLKFKQLREDNDYLIYSDGRLFSKKTNRFLKGKIDSVGYQVYALQLIDAYSVSNRKLSKMVYAHRLVAQYFLPNPNNYQYVHHKDGNRTNNNVSNLEWVSPELNMKYYREQKHFKKAKKEDILLKPDLKNEWWKVFAENELYSVSNFGRVKNNKTDRVLYLDKSHKYIRVQLNNKKHYMVHRMVYSVFNDDYDLEGFVVDHIDNNSQNNKEENLQKITQQENCLRQARFND